MTLSLLICPISFATFHKAKQEDLSLAKTIDLTLNTAYDVADFGFELYEEGKNVGSKTVFEALVMLTHRDAYFYTMVGANNNGYYSYRFFNR